MQKTVKVLNDTQFVINVPDSMFLPLLWFSLVIIIMTHNWIFVKYFP